MQGVLRLVLYLLALTAGGLALGAALDPEFASQLLAHYAEQLTAMPTRVGTAAVGMLLILLPMAILARWYASRRYAKEIDYPTESGTVSVSLQAIEEALVRVLEPDPSVRKVALRVLDNRMKRQVLITCVMSLWDDGDVTSINKRCQDLLRKRFRELMPEQTDVRIDITVHRLSQRQAGYEKPPAAAPEPSSRRSGHEPMPLPGLQATQGLVSSEAGAALLARRRKQTDSGAQPLLPDDGSLVAEATATETFPGSDIDFDAIEDELADSDPLQNLYVGPRYSVEEEEDDEDDERR